jgi:hypothetical protein
MTSIARETAKFLSGYAAAETLGHWWMGIWGGDLLPMTIGGFVFTPTLNTYCMIAWPIVLMTLVYFAWIHKGRRASPSPA